MGECCRCGGFAFKLAGSSNVSIGQVLSHVVNVRCTVCIQARIAFPIPRRACCDPPRVDFVLYLALRVGIVRINSISKSYFEYMRRLHDPGKIFIIIMERNTSARMTEKEPH